MSNYGLYRFQPQPPNYGVYGFQPPFPSKRSIWISTPPLITSYMDFNPHPLLTAYIDLTYPAPTPSLKYYAEDKQNSKSKVICTTIQIYKI